MRTEFEVIESERFLNGVEEAALWLYIHNFEQSESFAEKKYLELQYEIERLKNRLSKTPEIGRLDEILDVRRHPVYDGRFAAVWTVQMALAQVVMLDFIDSKYPRIFES